MVKCPKCHSTAIGSIRMDWDWGSGGDWVKTNDCGVYTEEEIKSFDHNERPSIDCYICCRCNAHFDEVICLPNATDHRAEGSGASSCWADSINQENFK